MHDHGYRIPIQTSAAASRAAGGEPHARSGLLADFILERQDGMVNVLGIVLGLAAASTTVRIILAGGLSGFLAEAMFEGLNREAVRVESIRLLPDHTSEVVLVPLAPKE